MRDTSQLGSHNFFLTTQSLILAINHTHGKCFGFQHGLNRFQQYFIGGRHLGEALNGLSLNCDVTKTLLMRLKINPKWQKVCGFR